MSLQSSYKAQLHQVIQTSKLFKIMLILGIETSGRSGSVALLQEGQLLAEKDLAATGRRHARTLIPEIQNTLTLAEKKVDQLTGVAVSIGPGSFTGLRVGVVCAKTIAYATRCQLVGVDTFESIASQSSSLIGNIWVIDDALRGELFAGQYRQTASQEFTCLQRPKLVSIEEFERSLGVDDLVSGPGVRKLAPQFDHLNLVESTAWTPSARLVAEIGASRIEKGVNDDFWSLLPDYLRRSAAEEKAESTKS